MAFTSLFEQPVILCTSIQIIKNPNDI